MSCHEREALTLPHKMALFHEALLHVDNLTHRSISQMLRGAIYKAALLLRRTFGEQARFSRSLDLLFKYASWSQAPRARLGPPPSPMLWGVGERSRRTVMNNAG